MRVKVLLILAIMLCFIISCKKNEKSYCQFNLMQLLANDTPHVYTSYADDSVIEVREKTKNGFGGMYRFDQKKNLRFYGFFINDSQFYYSEEYDHKGNILQKEGVPMVTFDVFRKKNNDTILFTGSLFSLNKKYENIEIISNLKDTIRPSLLYKSELYTNMKEFFFTLPVAKNINDLVLYASGTVINICNQRKESFYDTVMFKGVKL